MRWWVFLALVGFAVGLVGCDHASKHLAEVHLGGQPRVDLVPGVLDLTYTRNHDVGFSLLRAVPPPVRSPLILATSSVASVLLAVAWARRHAAPWSEQLGWAFLVAGALGNLLDRLLRGYVVDFVHLRSWPVFNFADVFLCVGAGLMLLAYRKRSGPGSAAPAPG